MNKIARSKLTVNEFPDYIYWRFKGQRVGYTAREMESWDLITLQSKVSEAEFALDYVKTAIQEGYASEEDFEGMSLEDKIRYAREMGERGDFYCQIAGEEVGEND